MARNNCNIVILLLLLNMCGPSSALEPTSYPRIMGIAISEPSKYEEPDRTEQLSRVDLLILNFWPDWRNERYGKEGINIFVRRLKSINPNIKIGQYTVLSEAKDTTTKYNTMLDIAEKIESENWWLRGPIGNKVQYTDKFDAWEVNISSFTKQDTDGFRYPEWLAHRNYKKLFKNTDLDFWYLDNSMNNSPILLADWNQDGIPDLSSSTEIAASFRQGGVAYWNAIRNLQPNTLLVANSDDISSPEYRQQLNGAVLEALMGKSWSLFKYKGWEAVLKRYYSFMTNTRAPHWVGFNVWGKKDNYQRMRFGLTTCLLNDGYFSYTDEDRGYAEIPWFDEYDVNLGQPLESPPGQPWHNGVYKRLFENGIVIVNPTKDEITISLEKEYRKIRGTQDPKTNSGLSVQSVTIKPEDGIILLLNAPPEKPILEVSPNKNKLREHE